MPADQETSAPLPTPPKRPLIWRLLGLRRRQGKWLRIVPTLWGWCWILPLVMGATMGGFMEYSMQPSFCRSCHLMEPYYQAWHQSTHKNVPCGDCHFEPGLQNTLKGKFQASSQAVKYITGTYGSKPHAEVRDESCLRDGCHERRILEGKVKWKVPTSRGGSITIRFDHTPHMQDQRRGKELRCVSCHSQIVQGQHIVVTLDTCFLCHFKGLKHGREDQTVAGCRSCHDAPTEQIRLATGTFNHADYINRGVKCQNCHADAVWGDGLVPKQVCWNCHNQPEKLTHYGESALMHKTHVSQHKVECFNCHIQIVHSLAAGATPQGDNIPGTGHLITQAGGCGQCHSDLHTGILSLYRGTGGRGVPDMPSPMFRTRVDCIACHQQTVNGELQAQAAGQTYRATPQACINCHGQNRYGDLLSDWKKEIVAKLDEAQRVLTDTDTAFAKAALAESGGISGGASGGASGGRKLELERLLDDARWNVELVRFGHGAHNVPYATALLSKAMENCRTITVALGATAKPVASLQP